MELKGYITNLADYNAGRLNGEWLTFPATEEEAERETNLIIAALVSAGCVFGDAKDNGKEGENA